MQSIKKLERYIYNIPAARRLNMLGKDARESMTLLCTAITTARASVDIYSTSDDTAEQAQALGQSIALLKVVNEAILKASSYDLLDVADVAHLSALNEHILERLG